MKGLTIVGFIVNSILLLAQRRNNLSKYLKSNSPSIPNIQRIAWLNRFGCYEVSCGLIMDICSLGGSKRIGNTWKEKHLQITLKPLKANLATVMTAFYHVHWFSKDELAHSTLKVCWYLWEKHFFMTTFFLRKHLLN